TATTLLPSDSTFANATSCNPLDTGIVSVTNPNQFGCDSVHTTATTLLPSDATFVNAASCNPLDTGVISVTNTNQFGCDSVHTITTALLPSNSTFVNLNSCNPADTGIVSVTNPNQFGCDSTHIIATSLLPSSSSLTQLNACDSITWIDGITYTSNTNLVDTLIAANGCDSVATIQINIAQSSANPIQILLCPDELPYLLDNGELIDGSQVTIVDSLFNTFGCDSLITYDIIYAPDYYISPDMLLASLGDSVSFAVNNPSTDVLVSYTSDNGENCESPCNDYLLFPTEAVNNYYFSLIDTVTECTYSDILTIEINLYSELNVPNIFTPNGDGSNETFRCFGKNIDQYQLSIFDRWGGKMFETNLLDEGWDGLFLGQAIENGIYIAIIQATGLDGQKYTITQNIKLVR
ncbi:gliding motility-associated C-terminal domain-containing protein, partial [Chitinophagales bacterium]|nr:gliding motility-associated C-terminal domain-containing protein [Chitinophagales bacterium]